jgi:hypothetical protein
MGRENDFEMTEVELMDFKPIVVCIHRSPHTDFHTFLNKLETVICKVQMKEMKLILCGDWNINFLQDSAQLRALQNLLNTYNLINTVKSPTRVAKNSVSLIDVMIIDKLHCKNSTEVLDLGYSDHFAQMLHIKVNRPKTGDSFQVGIYKNSTIYLRMNLGKIFFIPRSKYLIIIS